MDTTPWPVVAYRKILDSRHHRLPLLPSKPGEKVGIAKLVWRLRSEGETIQPGLKRGEGKAVHLGLANESATDIANRLYRGLTVQSGAYYTPLHLMGSDNSDPAVHVIRCRSTLRKRDIWIKVREVAPSRTVVTLQSKVSAGAGARHLKGYVREDYVFLQKMMAEGFKQWPRQLKDDGIDDFTDTEPIPYEPQIPLGVPPHANIGIVLPHEFTRPCPHCGEVVEIDRLAGHAGGNKNVQCPHCRGTFAYHKAGYPV